MEKLTGTENNHKSPESQSPKVKGNGHEALAAYGAAAPGARHHFVRFWPDAIKLLGDVWAVILCEEVCYLSGQTPEAGYFKFTMAEWRARIGISRRNLEYARRILLQYPQFFDYKLSGGPALPYYWGDTSEFYKAVWTKSCSGCTKRTTKVVQNEQPRLLEMRNLSLSIPDSKSADLSSSSVFNSGTKSVTTTTTTSSLKRISAQKYLQAAVPALANVSASARLAIIRACHAVESRLSHFAIAYLCGMKLAEGHYTRNLPGFLIKALPELIEALGWWDVETQAARALCNSEAEYQQVLEAVKAAGQQTVH